MRQVQPVQGVRDGCAEGGLAEHEGRHVAALHPAHLAARPVLVRLQDALRAGACSGLLHLVMQLAQAAACDMHTRQHADKLATRVQPAVEHESASSILCQSTCEPEWCSCRCRAQGAAAAFL